MRRTSLALPAASLMAATILTAAPAHAVVAETPLGITSVTASPGPGVGEVTVTWAQDGAYTTGYVLETALSSFSKTNPNMALPGRHPNQLTISGDRRSITLSAAQVSAAGAPVASGNHLYFRFYAVNTTSAGDTTTRAYPYLQAVLPRPQAPASKGTRLRIASFNVRSARFLTDERSWLQRAPDVAAEIVSQNPGIAALQELGPGRADGQTGTLKGTARQTDSLLTALAAAKASKYKLVRSTPYVRSGSPSSTQGARILYDSTRYTLVSDCPNTTGKYSYSASCSIMLPLLTTDSEGLRRRAAVAKFRNQTTLQTFFFVSAHLDHRHSTNATTEASYDALRKRQADTIVSEVALINTAKLPVIIGGDMNSWQNNRIGNGPHDTLVAQGFYDLSAAVNRVDFQYTTMNHFRTTLPPAAQGVGSRLDALFVKGAPGSSSFENVMDVTDAERPSDHNMVVADIVIPVTAPPAPTSATRSCADGGGVTWKTKVVWGNPYKASDGTTRVKVNYAGWTTPKRGAIRTDSQVRVYNGSGTRLQSLTRRARFDYKSGTTYDMRNPLNPPSDPGRAKITLRTGVDGDGLRNCVVTFLQPTFVQPAGR